MAEQRKLIFVQPDQDYPPFWDFDRDYSPSDIRPNSEPPSLEQIAKVCDRDAENCNAHDFVGAHRLLAALLCRTIGRTQATRIFLEIAGMAGLHSMNGLCGRDDAFAALSCGESGKDWNGTFVEPPASHAVSARALAAVGGEPVTTTTWRQ